MPLSNPGWVGYWDRSYDQLKANILTLFQSLVPEITDHTETNTWVKGISIWSGAIEMLGYYTDANAREIYITTAQEFESAVKLAKQYDFRVRGPVPASVTVRFTSSIAATGNIVIPIGTVIRTENNEIFTTTTAGTITTGNTFIDVQAKQWEAVTNVALGNSDGSPDQEFVLEEDVADGSVTVLVDVTTYTPKETFAESFNNSTDFIAGIQEDTRMRILFGDNENGKIPPSGNAITSSYYITLGSAGRVGAGKINTIVSAITVPGAEVMSVTNALNATGGTDFENLTKLAKRIPYSFRTRWRGVTDTDFIYLTELFQGVEKAGVQFDCDVDDDVFIFIVPDGGGAASQPLIDDVKAFLEERKVILIPLIVQSAGQVQAKLTIAATALPGYSNSQVSTNIKAALVAFGSSANQDIGGSMVIGDVYQAIEAAAGVKSSTVNLIVAVPYARNMVTLTNNLDWIRNILPTSVTTQKWLIRFTTVSTFDLYRGTEFVTNSSVDVLIVLTELNLMVNGNHQSGDDYEFWTYPYNQSIILQEPSIPAILESNLTITVTGGV